MKDQTQAAQYLMDVVFERINVCISDVSVWEQLRGKPGLGDPHTQAIHDLFGAIIGILRRITRCESENGVSPKKHIVQAIGLLGFRKPELELDNTEREQFYEDMKRAKAERLEMLPADQQDYFDPDRIRERVFERHQNILYQHGRSLAHRLSLAQKRALHDHLAYLIEKEESEANTQCA